MKNNRRHFLLDLSRGTAAAALIAMTGFLLSRRTRGKPVINRERHTCSNQWICRDCSHLADCVLPQALSARKRGVK